jgi:hypothetical protein
MTLHYGSLVLLHTTAEYSVETWQSQRSSRLDWLVLLVDVRAAHLEHDAVVLGTSFTLEWDEIAVSEWSMVQHIYDA